MASGTGRRAAGGGRRAAGGGRRRSFRHLRLIGVVTAFRGVKSADRGRWRRTEARLERGSRRPPDAGPGRGLPGLRLVRLMSVSARNQSPRRCPVGQRIHRRTATVWLGSALAKTGPTAATALRAVDSSGKTITEPMHWGRHPRSRASRRGTTRSFMSMERRTASRLSSSLFTSTSSTALAAAFQARMSTEPRSPKSLNEYSGRTVHSRPSRATTALTSRAWRASSNRSGSGPCVRKASPISIWSAAPMRLIVASVRSSARPRSSIETVCWATPAAAATSA
jgi:hypothetical protein